MNYKKIIEMYEKKGRVNKNELSFCVRFYWDVKHLSGGYKAHQAINYMAKRYNMTENEAEFIYGIGNERIDYINNLKFERYDPRHFNTSLLRDSTELERPPNRSLAKT